MGGKHLLEQARRVVSGEDQDGRSTIVDDGFAARRVASPAFTVCDIWETKALPIALTEGAAEGQVVLMPPEAGFIFRVTTFPPDNEFDREEFGSALDDMGGALDSDSKIPGMHKSDTLDIVTVISGEIYVVLETAETLLKQGDTVILRGSMHAWSNRSDEPCKITSLMMAARRA
jgi:mannose-6-phosphate isomerase-like protein (cupin superfamily)